jgi:beta-glucanase (GH16 family)
MAGITAALWLYLLTSIQATLPALPSYPGLTLAFESDFNSIDGFNVADSWVQTPYAQVCYTARNVDLVGGYLMLKTQKEDVMCSFHGTSKTYSFSSGWVDTFNLHTATSGLVEISAKLPSSSISAIWPAGWIIANSNNRDQGTCWPLAPEIDVFEQTGGLGSSPICGSLHWGNQCNVDRGIDYGCTPAGTADSAFHVYAVRWGPDGGGYVTWILDGVVFAHQTKQSPNPAVTLPFSSPMALVLNTALSFFSGAAPTIIPDGGAFYIIDWIRLWDGSAT